MNAGDDQNEGLQKILVDLPNHWATGGESLWAMPLGNDEFEIRNTPFYAYGLNWGDVVLAISLEPGLRPVVKKVIRASGNRTLRVFFSKEVDRELQIDHLDRLKTRGLSYERATRSLIALDIEASSDFDSICNDLWKLEKDGVLHYETCEARAEGRFDEGPESVDATDAGIYEN